MNDDRSASLPSRFLRIRLPSLSPAAAAGVLELLDEIVLAFVEAYDAELTEDARWENELEEYEQSRTSALDLDDEPDF